MDSGFFDGTEKLSAEIQKLSGEQLEEITEILFRRHRSGPKTDDITGAVDSSRVDSSSSRSRSQRGCFHAPIIIIIGSPHSDEICGLYGLGVFRQSELLLCSILVCPVQTERGHNTWTPLPAIRSGFKCTELCIINCYPNA